MVSFAVRRLIGMIAVLFAISVIVFLIFNVIPNSDPAQRIAGKNANPALIARVSADLGLDRSLPVQYLTMMKQIFTGQLTSYASSQNVGEQIWKGFPPRCRCASARRCCGWRWPSCSVTSAPCTQGISLTGR